MPLNRCNCLEIVLANLRRATEDPSASLFTVVVTDGEESAQHPALTIKYCPKRKNFTRRAKGKPVIVKPVTSFVPPVFCPFCGKRIKITETENQ
jgi:hypothetical protein